MRQRFALNVSVFVIVRDGEKILLLRRAGTGWKDGFYSLPAGGHDGNEPLAVAAARELKEETGLITNPEKMRLVHLLHCSPGESGSEWLGAFFAAEEWSGSPTLLEPDKHDKLGWHAIGDLPENLIPYTRQGIELAARGVASSAFGWPPHQACSDSPLTART